MTHYVGSASQSTALSCNLCDSDNPLTKQYTIPAVIKIQSRFPRSKKRRIRKKWSKQDRNFKAFSTTFVVMGEKMAEALRAFGKDEGLGHHTYIQQKRVSGRGYEFGIRADNDASFDSDNGERRTDDVGELPIREVVGATQYPPQHGH